MVDAEAATEDLPIDDLQSSVSSSAALCPWLLDNSVRADGIVADHA